LHYIGRKFIIFIDYACVTDTFIAPIIDFPYFQLGNCSKLLTGGINNVFFLVLINKISPDNNEGGC